ncbi:MAG: class I tRNA ligase family protein, partial [Nanoarchaeota archaeon]
MVDFKAIEKKWQNKWEKEKAFHVKEDKKNKMYVLEMFPYPSSSGLHMGHAFNYTIGDIYARYKRMNGYNVLYPMGYDALGLPAENAAIKAQSHPKKFTEEAIKNFIKQQKELGLSYDWSRMIKTCDPGYYKWNQYFFLKFLENGLIYRKKAPVNFCGKCNTVLANEQVHSGKCWRHQDTNVEIKHLEQWFIKTTKYADELLRDIEILQWPERIKTMQRNWIGKSHGIEINFKINEKDWPIFTTRPDTIFGVTFMVVSAQHPKLMELVTKEQKKEVENFLKKIKSTSEKDSEELEKEGAFTGSYAINPLTKEKVPVYAGNFVVAEYGSGMVMAVPAHDQRDFEFAKKYKIPIKQVIAPVFVTTEGKDAVRKDKKTETRNSIFAIVKHWKEDKYFLLDWKNFKWKSFVIGGVDNGEKAEDAAIREVKEETGYTDIKRIKEIGFENHGNYYAEHKGVNRYAKFKTFLVELKSDRRGELEEEHTKHHEGMWIDKEKVKDFINLSNNKYVWDIYSKGERAFTEEGVLVNSKEFNGVNSGEAIDKISDHIEKKKLGKRTVNYKLRDWLVSRQRYWGTPIPIVYCDKCGIVPVLEKELPILLPEKVKFGEGNPLETNKKFLETKCPKCKGKARRETDTMDTFFDSSWYFLRFCDPKNNKEPFNKDKIKYWMPVDQYIGGAEHACMHLIYARFFTKALRDLGFVGLDEPFIKLFNQGMLHGDDGAVMSKSRGNVVLPEEVSKKYGIDTARLFLISLASPDKDIIWSDNGIEGSLRFINKLFEYFDRIKIKKSSKRSESKLNKVIKEVSENIENLRYNLAVIKIRELFDNLQDEESKDTLEKALKILSPFCPHISEELWHKLGNKKLLCLEEWPEIDENKIDEKLEEQDRLVKKLIEDINNVVKIINSKGKEVKKVFVYALPNEKENYDIKLIKTKLDVKIFAVNDKNKYDPENKAGKAKPG